MTYLLSSLQRVRVSLLLWGLLLFVLGMSWYGDIALPYTQVWLILPALLVMRDVRAYLVDMRPLQQRNIDRKKVIQARDKKQVPAGYPLAVANRQYVFPVLLTIYLCFLLIQQSGIFDLQYSLRYLALDEQMLLMLTLVSAGCLVWKESYDETYMYVTQSIGMTRVYILFSGVFGMLSAYIILQQVVSLQLVGIAIANIAGILIFLVGVLLLDDDLPSS